MIAVSDSTPAIEVSTDALLAVDNLTVSYQIGRTHRDVLHGVSLHIAPRQVYGLVGESGSGKSTLALAVMRYLPANGRISGGQITLAGESLINRSTRDMRHIWGKQIALVPQDPGGSLNPAMTIGAQVSETIRQQNKSSAPEADQISIEWLRKVRIADAERVATAYPHQISGGMQQRVLIAMALCTAPKLLVLDEPTTNLDVTTEAAMLDLFRDLIGEHGTAALYVTHNLGVVAQVCQRVAVLYAGEMMEDAAVGDLFARPLHPYTITLLNAIPRLGQARRPVIAPNSDRSASPAIGCAFAARCPLAIEKCFTTKPTLEQVDPNHAVKCHRWPEIASGELSLNPQGEGFGVSQPVRLPVARTTEKGPGGEVLVNLRAVGKTYALGLPLLRRLQGGSAPVVKAVDAVTLDIGRAQTVGLVGESGSGKTTLARCVIGLIARDSGQIELLDMQLSPALANRSAEARRRVQMVFQNPEESLNPYLTIGESLRRPLITLRQTPRAEIDGKIQSMLRAVRLPEHYANRLPGELSGGEKQRAAIARAFITDPDLVICDEAVSALDVSVQAAILDLLRSLRDVQHTSYLFISHDLAVVGSLADVIAVMYLGQLVEVVPYDQLLTTPLHPYTEALLAAIPIPDPLAAPPTIRLNSDTPSPTHLPSGCRFHTRCPRKIGPICEQTEPPITNVGDGHWLRCHIPLDELAALQGKTLAGKSTQEVQR
jgi:peptide/nickel transport system ATP-binding protein